jgi:iron-sulfur cluster repair protein YtfE (RIC family)
MNALLRRLAPNATDIIRADHTRVVAAFHRYKLDSNPALRRSIAASICLDLEVHAQLEEEIFYPAMRKANAVILDKLAPEHEEIRRLIALLRSLDPNDLQFDQTLMELMRQVMHHVADEETILLPSAEAILGGRLGELGARMTKRRFELTAPRAGELVRHRARAMPPATMLAAAGAVIAGLYLLRGRR